jgi:multidrug efflux pump subunit AcrA (membrane-fusion protein)
VKPVLGDITESVYASVTIRPELSYFPQANRSGIIETLLVEEGDLVKKGQALLHITATADVGNRLRQAELNLSEARANYLGEDNMLLNLEKELVSLQEQLSLDSLNYKRQERLWNQGIGKRIDLDRAKLAYEAASNNVDILQKRYAQTRINLKNNYQKAQSLVRAERSQLGDYTVRSTMDGKVYTLNKEVGELISPQEKIAEIGSSNRFIIEMDIDEVDIAKISLGDSVAITLEAYPGEVFLAKTSRIVPRKDELTQTFRVESVFLDEIEKLYSGLSGEANIMVATRKNAMIVPSEYVIEGNKVITSDGEQEVKIGVTNMEFTEILSGIDTTTTLIKPEE